MDTAPSVLFCLGLQQPLHSSGRPVLEALSDYVDFLHKFPGYGFQFSWGLLDVVEDSANFTSSSCFRGKEQCARVVYAVNPSFVIGFFSGILFLCLLVSCLSLTCVYVQPDTRKRCLGILEVCAIWSRVKEDLIPNSGITSSRTELSVLNSMDQEEDFEDMEEHSRLLQDPY